jgi:2'-5' RNA ligase
MLLSQLYEREEVEDEVNGSYVAVSFSEDSQNRLTDFAHNLKLSNLVPKDKYHVTVIYSRIALPKEFKVQNLSEVEPLIVTPKHFSVFPTQSGKKALVLELDSPELVERHTSIMDKYDATYDFDEYKPHVTLSYDMGDFELPDDIDERAKNELGELEIIEEYHEPLQLDWAEKNT